ncbi:MAG TPA: protein kinase [Burkholderiales bacterium]|jgi:serine/threonine protein kinase|nr:protein kinase [Burkholderiales bacterium]
MPVPTTYQNALPLASMLLEYRLESVLGAGAFGMTYLARDTHLDKQVAIKEYLPTDLAVRALDGSVVPITTDHGYNYQWGLDRFIQEARTLAKFSHPNIVRVNRYFEANGTGYMVMDYEQGSSLAQLLRDQSPPAEARLRALILPLLDGLEAVHAAGFLHRDIKPANVFVRANGVPVLLDFGAARQAVSGTTKSLTSILTPGYAPLEQYSSDGHQGPWSDIYALAGVVYRVLVNENPPDAVSRMRQDVVRQKLAGARGRASEPLIRSVEWALVLDESKRPQSVAEWKRAILGEVPVALPASTVAPKVERAPSRPLRREVEKPALFAWRWVVIGLLLTVAVAWMASWKTARPPEKAASPRTSDGAVRPAQKAEGPGAARDRPPRERIERPGIEDADPEQVRLWALREFQAADTNGDGFLSPDEVRRFPYIAKEFARVDADGDGRISTQEFVKLRRMQGPKKPPG